MVSAPELQAAGFGVGLTVGKGVVSHPVAFMEFVEQDESPLFLRNRVIDPDFPRGDKLVHVIVSTSREVDVEDAAHEPAVHNPYADAVLQLLPESLMGAATVRELLPMMGCLGTRVILIP